MDRAHCTQGNEDLNRYEGLRVLARIIVRAMPDSGFHERNQRRQVDVVTRPKLKDEAGIP